MSNNKTQASGATPNNTESLCAEESLPPLVFTVEQVAGMLQVTPKTVYRLVSRGLLKSTKALRHLRITRRSLDEFLANTGS